MLEGISAQVDLSHQTKIGTPPIIKVFGRVVHGCRFYRHGCGFYPRRPSPSRLAALQRGNNRPAWKAQPGASEADRTGDPRHHSARAAQSGISDKFKDLRHAIVEIVSKNNAARAAWETRSRSPFIQDKHNDDILAAKKSYRQSAELHRNSSVHRNHPFWSGIMRMDFKVCSHHSAVGARDGKLINGTTRALTIINRSYFAIPISSLNHVASFWSKSLSRGGCSTTTGRETF